MIDLIKEMVSAANSRVKSPILGSITFIFVIINWKELFFLFFADVSVYTRISYFEANSDHFDLILYPVLAGILFAALYPWITLIGGLLARFPVGAVREMQATEDHKRHLLNLKNAADAMRAKAEFEAESEKRVLAAASRLKEAEQISDEAFDELQRVRGDESHELQHEEQSVLQLIGSLEEYAGRVLIALSENVHGEGFLTGDQFDPSQNIEHHRSGALSFRFSDGHPAEIKIPQARRHKIKFQNAINQLIRQGLISEKKRGDNYILYEINEAGFRIADLLD